MAITINNHFLLLDQAAILFLLNVMCHTDELLIEVEGLFIVSFASFGLTPAAILFGYTRGIPRDLKATWSKQTCTSFEALSVGFKPRTSRSRVLPLSYNYQTFKYFTANSEYADYSGPY